MIDNIDFTNIEANPDNANFIIYHNPCCDGFGSAFSAYEYLHKKFPERKVTYFPASHGSIPPIEEIKNKHVVICDFSYKKEDLLKIIKLAKSFVILDHHKTTEEKLKDIPKKYKIFRMDHSGAYLTWRYFHRNKQVPMMIKYIEDRDIWNKKLKHTDEINTYIYSLAMTFEEYAKLLDENFINNIAYIYGDAMLKQNEKIISSAIKFASPKFVKLKDKYYFVSHLNSSILKSELGNRAFNEYPNINFSLTYSIKDWSNSTIFSLRSLDTATDVSNIAKIFDGGGHKCASGVKINYVANTLPWEVVDYYKTYFILDNIEFEKYDNVNIVNLNSSHYKYELAKYLLQKRTENKDGTIIQECSSIRKNRDKINDEILCQVSVVWNYEGYDNCTYYNIQCNNNRIEILLKKLLKTGIISNYKFSKGHFWFSVNGLVSSITKLLLIAEKIKDTIVIPIGI